MMKTMWRRAAALLLAAAMTVALAACGREPVEERSSADSSAVESSSAGSSSTQTLLEEYFDSEAGQAALADAKSRLTSEETSVELYAEGDVCHCDFTLENMEEIPEDELLVLRIKLRNNLAANCGPFIALAEKLERELFCPISVQVRYLEPQGEELISDTFTQEDTVLEKYFASAAVQVDISRLRRVFMKQGFELKTDAQDDKVFMELTANGEIPPEKGMEAREILERSFEKNAEAFIGMAKDWAEVSGNPVTIEITCFDLTGANLAYASFTSEQELPEKTPLEEAVESDQLQKQFAEEAKAAAEQGIDVKVYAEGNTLYYQYAIGAELSEQLSEEDIEGFRPELEASLVQNSAAFTNVAQQLGLV